MGIYLVFLFCIFSLFIYLFIYQSIEHFGLAMVIAQQSAVHTFEKNSPCK